jgi:hypothetical protein
MKSHQFSLFEPASVVEPPAKERVLRIVRACLRCQSPAVRFVNNEPA